LPSSKANPKAADFNILNYPIKPGKSQAGQLAGKNSE